MNVHRARPRSLMFSPIQEPGIPGAMANSGTEAENIQDHLEHSVVLESKKVLKTKTNCTDGVCQRGRRLTERAPMPNPGII